MLANIYAFTTDLQEMATSRGLLLIELGILRKEYDSLLYGGSIDTLVGAVSDSVMADAEFGNVAPTVRCFVVGGTQDLTAPASPGSCLSVTGTASRPLPTGSSSGFHHPNIPDVLVFS